MENETTMNQNNSYLEEIKKIFSDKTNHANFITAFFDGASEKTRQKEIEIKEKIISDATSDITTALKHIDELCNISTAFQEEEKRNQTLIETTKVLISITDKFTKKEFKYENPGEYAYILVNRDEENVLLFEDFTKYREDAKKAIENPSSVENFEPIYSNLSDTYSEILKIGYVKNTIITNYLDTAGFKPKNIAIGAGIVAATTILGALSTIGGAPDMSLGANLGDFLGYFFTPGVPLWSTIIGSGLGLAGWGIPTTITQLGSIDAKEKLKKLSQEDKEKALTSAKEIQKSTSKDNTQRKIDLVKNMTSFDYGLFPSAGITQIDKASNFSDKLEYPGANLIERIRIKKLKKKLSIKPNEDINNALRKLENELDSENPLYEKLKLSRINEQEPTAEVETKDTLEISTESPTQKAVIEEQILNSNPSSEEKTAVLEEETIGEAIYKYSDVEDVLKSGIDEFENKNYQLEIKDKIEVIKISITKTKSAKIKLNNKEAKKVLEEIQKSALLIKDQNGASIQPIPGVKVKIQRKPNEKTK